MQAERRDKHGNNSFHEDLRCESILRNGNASDDSVLTFRNDARNSSKHRVAAKCEQQKVFITGCLVLESDYLLSVKANTKPAKIFRENKIDIFRRWSKIRTSAY